MAVREFARAAEVEGPTTSKILYRFQNLIGLKPMNIVNPSKKSMNIVKWFKKKSRDS